MMTSNLQKMPEVLEPGYDQTPDIAPEEPETFQQELTDLNEKDALMTGLAEKLKEWGLSPRDIFKVSWGVDELATNAMTHGKSEYFKAEAKKSGTLIEITITDHSPIKFNPFADAPDFDPNIPVEGREQEGGVGLPVIKEWAINPRYERTEKGNRITFGIEINSKS